MKIILAAALLGVVALPAIAAPVCNGQVAVIRVSTLKNRAGFDKAVADQAAWYKSHGVTTNRIVEADVIDLSSGKPQVSTKEAITIHYDPPAATGAQPASDDAYKAFVKEFRDSSDIAVEKDSLPAEISRARYQLAPSRSGGSGATSTPSSTSSCACLGVASP